MRRAWREVGFCGEEWLETLGFLEKCDAENLQNVGEAAVDVEFLFHDGDEDVDADGDPDLGLHGVFGVAVERFDVEVLFDPFEKEFDLPAAAIELGDGRCREGEVVRQEGKAASTFGIIKRDSSQRLVV